jgi:anti-sigma-K factor RskA
MVHNDYKEMIPAHALSALEAADERALNEHLVGCAECRRDLAEWEAVSASLALSADPFEPSPQLRKKILESVSSVVPFARPQRNLWQRLGSLGSIAAVLAFAALVVSVIVLWQQNRTLREQNELYQLLTAPGSKVAQLSGTSEATTATARLAYDNNGRALLIADGLPRAPAGKEYQLWYIVNNKPLPGKTFAPDSSGRGVLKDQVPDAIYLRSAL